MKNLLIICIVFFYAISIYAYETNVPITERFKLEYRISKVGIVHKNEREAGFHLFRLDADDGSVFLFGCSRADKYYVMPIGEYRNAVFTNSIEHYSSQEDLSRNLGEPSFKDYLDFNDTLLSLCNFMQLNYLKVSNEKPILLKYRYSSIFNEDSSKKLFFDGFVFPEELIPNSETNPKGVTDFFRKYWDSSMKKWND